MFLKKIKGTTAEQQGAVPLARIQDKIVDLKQDFYSWVVALDDTPKLAGVFEEFRETLNAGSHKSAV